MSFACRINVLKPKLNSHVQTSAVRYVLYLKLKKTGVAKLNYQYDYYLLQANQD